MPKPKLRGVYKIVKVKIEDLKAGDKFFLMEGKNKMLMDDRMHPDRFIFKAIADGTKEPAPLYGKVQCDSVDVK